MKNHPLAHPFDSPASYCVLAFAVDTLELELLTLAGPRQWVLLGGGQPAGGWGPSGCREPG